MGMVQCSGTLELPQRNAGVPAECSQAPDRYRCTAAALRLHYYGPTRSKTEQLKDAASGATSHFRLRCQGTLGIRAFREGTEAAPQLVPGGLGCTP